jgi:hypothetical protein
MKRTILTVTVLLIASGLFAQVSEPAPETIGVNTAQQRLQEISVSKFEDPGFWRVYMPLDQGLITSRRFEGAPADKEPIPEEVELGIDEPDRYVLGVKAEFFRRMNTQISIQPLRPIAVPGITKTISVWVVGRNANHRLMVVISDQFGNTAYLPMGTLNFTGWRELVVAVPPNIVQRNARYANREGIRIMGFVIEPELSEAFGEYYVYFDGLRATTDLFAEESRDPDDLPDNW